MGNYDILNANGAIDWVDLEPNDEIILSSTEERMFKMNTDLKCLTKVALEGDISDELVFANVFGTDFNNSKQSKVVTKKVKTGDKGAKLLRINSDVVMSLIEHDAKLCNSVQNLMFLGVC